MQTGAQRAATGEFVVYGASGYSLALGRCLAASRRVRSVAAYIDDFRGGRGERLGDIPIIEFEQWRDALRDLPCCVAVADPSARRRLVARVEAAGGSFIFPTSESGGATLGEGAVIFTPGYVGPLTSIGRHVQIMPLCSIGHDVVIEDFVTVCPSCAISGYVRVETGAFVGAGSTIVNGTADNPLIVGANARIHAGSVVTNSVSAGATVAGNPARTLRELASARRQGRGSRHAE